MCGIAGIVSANPGDRIDAETIARGIRETHWPGRFQVLSAGGDNPECVLDVAHNPAGAWALRSTLSAAYPDLGNGREITMVFGVMRDKAMQEITEILFPLAKHVIVTHASNPRSAGPDEIRQAAARVGEKSRRALLSVASSFFWLTYALTGLAHLSGPHRPDAFYGVSLSLMIIALLLRFADRFVAKLRGTSAIPSL